MVTCYDHRVYGYGGDSYGAAVRVYMNWRGSSEASGRLSVPLTVLRNGRNETSGVRSVSSWASVAVEITGIY